jgi:hypothetical protein
VADHVGEKRLVIKVLPTIQAMRGRSVIWYGGAADRTITAMPLGTALRRCNPFKPDVVALTEGPFDPRQQSWLAP